MRTVSFLSFLWLLLAPVATGTDPFVRPDVDTGLLPGTWRCTLGNVSNTVTFKADQTFSGELRLGGKVIDQYEGKWRAVMPYASAPELIWKYSKSSRLALPRTDRDYLEILNPKLLVIWSAPKERHAYHRVVPAVSIAKP